MTVSSPGAVSFPPPTRPCPVCGAEQCWGLQMSGTMCSRRPGTCEVTLIHTPSRGKWPFSQSGGRMAWAPAGPPDSHTASALLILSGLPGGQVGEAVVLSGEAGERELIDQTKYQTSSKGVTIGGKKKSHCHSASFRGPHHLTEIVPVRLPYIHRPCF